MRPCVIILGICKQQLEIRKKMLKARVIVCVVSIFDGYQIDWICDDFVIVRKFIYKYNQRWKSKAKEVNANIPSSGALKKILYRGFLLNENKISRIISRIFLAQYSSFSEILSASARVNPFPTCSWPGARGSGRSWS